MKMNILDFRNIQNPFFERKNTKKLMEEFLMAYFLQITPRGGGGDMVVSE